MANKSKAKGTAAETKIVKFLKAAGLDARRVALQGSKDAGDIYVVCQTDQVGITLEVKAGKQTQNVSRQQKEEWLNQTRVEGVNANTPSYLVIAKHGSAVKDYHVWSNTGRIFMYLDEFTKSLGGSVEEHKTSTECG